jgi:ubiquinone/menaquinone biosynthesis C-methylase UbiE
VSAGGAHRETTRREFSKQAASFERPGSLFRARDILDWIGEHVPVSPTDVVLDVAGGTGGLGRHLAERASFVLVADLTRAMLEAGASAAREEGTANVVFAEADATRLPFADAQFDLVVSRFAFHHFDEPAAAAAEMSRVCRPGGTVAVIDMTRSDGAAGKRRDELERLRDPSHARALPREELTEILRESGVDAELVAERLQQLDALLWLDQGQPGEAERGEVLAALEAEVEGGEPTGLRASRGDAGITIEHLYAIVRGPR